jgi:hypothetical protein
MIPNVFHFVFGLREQTEPFHLMYYLCLASCIHVNQPDAVHFHYHHEPWGEWWDRIKTKLVLRRISPDQAISNYRYRDPTLNQYRYAHLADVARLEILLSEGGVYADIDTLFLRPFPTHWREKAFILGQEKLPPGATGSLCNAWIASSPGAEFGRLWLEGMAQAFDGGWSNHSTLLPFELWRKHPELIDVQPETAFYALDYSPHGIDDLFLRSVPLPKNAYSLHLWNHLWFAPQRRDFSHFHSGRLTIDYVAHANTTYAHHARAHLPPDITGSASALRWQTALSGLRFPFSSLRAWLRRGVSL